METSSGSAGISRRDRLEQFWKTAKFNLLEDRKDLESSSLTCTRITRYKLQNRHEWDTSPYLCRTPRRTHIVTSSQMFCILQLSSTLSRRSLPSSTRHEDSLRMKIITCCGVASTATNNTQHILRDCSSPAKEIYKKDH
ncbi:uncharacterized [Tachysurus ichikawai]